MKTVFVTGGSGYIGRNLIRGLISAGYPVRSLARSATSAAVVKSLGAVPVEGDVLDTQSLCDGMSGCWAVVHAAADTRHGRSDSAQAETNVEGTHRVFRTARQQGLARGLQISSESVLADGRPLVRVDESLPIPARHAGEYSRTKALAELAALAEASEDFVVCALRPRFVWGGDDSSALPQLIEAAKAGRLKWIGGGRYLTSTTHITNVVAGSLAALERGRSGQTYFISDGDPVEFRRFITALLASQGVEAPRGNVPRWLVKALIAAGTGLEKISARRIQPPMTWQEYATLGQEVTVDDQRARRELDYTPVLSIEQGLAELRSRKNTSAGEG